MNKYILGICWEEKGYLIVKDVSRIVDCPFEEKHIHEERCGTNAFDLGEYDNTVVVTEEVSRGSWLSLEHHEINVLNYKDVFEK